MQGAWIRSTLKSITRSDTLGIKFAESMISTNHIYTEKLELAKIIIKIYLRLDIDAGTSPSSGVANDNAPSPTSTLCKESA